MNDNQQATQHTPGKLGIVDGFECMTDDIKHWYCKVWKDGKPFGLAYAEAYGKTKKEAVERAKFIVRAPDLEAENRRLKERLALFESAATKFINKVESGRARSVETYNDFKQALGHE
jgi:hypothetical protein